jgi:hypothetical protein
MKIQTINSYGKNMQNPKPMRHVVQSQDPPDFHGMGTKLRKTYDALQPGIEDHGTW